MNEETAVVVNEASDTAPLAEAAEAQAEAATDVAEAHAEAAVEIAEIEADKEIKLAEIAQEISENNNETAVAAAVLTSQRDEELWTRVSELELRLATAEAILTALSSSTPPITNQSTETPTEEIEAIVEPAEQAVAKEVEKPRRKIRLL